MQRDEKNFSANESLNLIEDIAAGLSALHDKRSPIVHRDLKPANILFDGEGKAKIADLGLAQVSGGLSQRTRLGSLAQPHPGTPAYMSPEQESSYGMLRPTSDIYSVGAIWFEMLSGVNYKMQPSGTTIIEFRDDLQGSLSKLIEDMLVKDADQRLWDGNRLLESTEILISQSKEIQQRSYQSDIVTKLPHKSEKAHVQSDVKEDSSVNIANQKGIINKNKISPTEKTIKDPQMPAADNRKRQNAKFRKFQVITEENGSKIIDLGEGIRMEFVYVPEGEFWMGSDEDDEGVSDKEKPKHKVYLDGYWIGK